MAGKFPSFKKQAAAPVAAPKQKTEGDDGNLLRICGLYSGFKGVAYTDKKGNQYLRGRDQDGYIFYIFENTFKKGDNEPDFILHRTREALTKGQD